MDFLLFLVLISCGVCDILNLWCWWFSGSEFVVFMFYHGDAVHDLWCWYCSLVVASVVFKGFIIPLVIITCGLYGVSNLHYLCCS